MYMVELLDLCMYSVHHLVGSQYMVMLLCRP